MICSGIRSRMKLASITIFASLLWVFCTFNVSAQSYLVDIARDSARSDARTGGTITTAEIEPGGGELYLSVNVPSFQMTLWLGDKEVKTYPVGIALKDYPIYIGLLKFDTIIFNPAWIPPASDWVAPSLQGKVIGPADPRNPLGKVKIPLGYGYLIHQAKGPSDLGNLVSHGCVRVMRHDLYDLSDKFLAAHSLHLDFEVSSAKRNKRTFAIELEEPVRIEITYDTQVIENGILRIYPDIYDRGRNSPGILRSKLSKNGLDVSLIKDRDLEAMLAKAADKSQYVISLAEIEKGNYFKGKVIPVLSQAQVRKKK